MVREFLYTVRIGYVDTYREFTLNVAATSEDAAVMEAKELASRLISQEVLSYDDFEVVHGEDEPMRAFWVQAHGDVKRIVDVDSGPTAVPELVPHQPRTIYMAIGEDDRWRLSLTSEAIHIQSKRTGKEARYTWAKLTRAAIAAGIEKRE